MIKKILLLFIILFSLNISFGQFNQAPKKNIDSILLKYSFNTTKIFTNTVTTNWGFFCKQEWKFEKASKIPLKIRLGSLAYCNSLEGYKY